MEPDWKSRAHRLAYAVSKRLAWILLRLGFSFGDFLADAKAAFVEAAAEHIEGRGHRASAARIAVLTGFSRAEVARIQGDAVCPSRPSATQRAERVMHGWFTDLRYVDGLGHPRELAISGHDSFDDLVRNYSGDIPPKAILEELLSGGMAQVKKRGFVTAVRRHYLALGSNAIDLEALIANTDVVFRSALDTPNSASASLRRISVRFPRLTPPAVRRTVNQRIERFFEALSDYLHTESNSASESRSATPGEELVLHVIVSQCEINESGSTPYRDRKSTERP